MPRYEPWSAERAQTIIGAYRGRKGPALPIFHALQHAFGCVPDEAIPMVAEALNLLFARHRKPELAPRKINN